MKRLPCKKCGKTNGRVIKYAPLINSTYRITCPNCGYATKQKSTIEDAEAAWNQRNE